ncbi:MAG: NAD-dependent epimerase/dehydratase family protein [Desulfobacteraceae bacterium]|nr:NAD-dependent epimerase/dehydratase family protein [Desulfobacteraceae bacterium]
MGKNLITGGHGFLGYYLAKLLLEEGEEVVLFDVVSESRFTEGIKDRVKTVRGDLRNWVQVLDVVKDNDISCIFHAGALIPPVTEQSPAAAYAVNVTGTFNVLEAARLFGVDRVIYLSTLATFGRDVPRIVPNDAPQHPPNMYGVTKLCSERLGEYYYTRFGVNFRGVRFPPIIGMGRFDKAQSAYNYLAIQETALGRPYTVYVDTSTTIALLYVKDAVWSLVDLKNAEDRKLTRRVYNLYGFSTTAQELVDSVERCIPEAQTDFKPDQEMITLVENLPQRLDDTLAREDWGWSTRYSLDQAVEDFIREIRAHRAIYE